MHTTAVGVHPEHRSELNSNLVRQGAHRLRSMEDEGGGGWEFTSLGVGALALEFGREKLRRRGSEGSRNGGEDPRSDTAGCIVVDD
jgi:hypothetical protein